MSDIDNEKLASSLSDMRKIVRKQTRLLDLIIHLFFENRLGQEQAIEGIQAAPITSKVVPLILQAAGSSCHTVLSLTKDVGLPIRDCISVSRTIVEALLNASFILAEGEDAAARAERHALQKTFRDFERKSDIAGQIIRVNYSHVIDPATVPGLADALQEFTGRRGQEVTDWSEKNYKDKLLSIEARFGKKGMLGLHTAWFSVYRHSSEIIHGTYFGCLYFFGVTNPTYGKSPKYAIAQLSSLALNALISIALAIDAVAFAFAERFQIDHVRLTSEEIFSEIYKIPMIAEELMMQKRNNGKSQ